MRNKPAETPEPHGYIESTWLSCVKPWDHGVAGADSGVTADQMVARHVGQDTRLPSLELTTAQGGARVAWRTPTQSLPQEGNPRAVFQKLFGQGDTDKERAAILAETGSILDRVKEQAARLQASLGVGDRVVVSDYLDAVREIERRVQMASRQDEASLSIPPDFDDRFQKGQFVGSIYGHGGAITEPYSMLRLYQGRSVAVPGAHLVNFARWKNEAFDKITDEMYVTDPNDKPKMIELFRRAMEIWLPELPDIQLVQNFHRIPMNTNYLKNWPTADNNYVNGASWHLTYPIVLWNLQPA